MIIQNHPSNSKPLVILILRVILQIFPKPVAQSKLFENMEFFGNIP